MTDADDAGLLGAGSASAGVTDPTNVAVLACLAVLAGESERVRLEAEVERLRQENERLQRAAAGMRAFAHALHKGPMETCTEGGCLVARLALAESPTSG